MATEIKIATLSKSDYERYLQKGIGYNRFEATSLLIAAVIVAEPVAIKSEILNPLSVPLSLVSCINPIFLRIDKVFFDLSKPVFSILYIFMLYLEMSLTRLMNLKKYG